MQSASLDGLTLGASQDTSILIDSNAAGWGWSANGGPGVDLVSVLEHEVGHALGFSHEDEGVMAPTLDVSAPPTDGSAGTPGGAAHPGLAGGTGFDAAPLFFSSDRSIDWSSPALETPVKIKKGDAPAVAQPAWLGDFVNHLARTESQRNPNLGIRVQVEPASRASASLNKV